MSELTQAERNKLREIYKESGLKPVKIPPIHKQSRLSSKALDLWALCDNKGIKMKPIVSILILTAYIMGLVYLLVVGALGAIYGEPLGFIFMALGITAGIPFYTGTKQFFNESK